MSGDVRGDAHRTILLARPDDFAGPEATARCRRILSAEECARESRYRQERDRLLSRTAHAVLRAALGASRGVPPECVDLQRDALGKPFVPGGPHCNLSHTPGLIAIVVADRPCGIDAETRSRSFDLLALADRYFARREIDWLDTLPPPARPDGFLRLWTAKEAWLKATGKGLRVPLSSVAVDLSGTEPRLADPADHAAWALQTLAFEDTHHVAVVIAQPQPTPRPWRLISPEFLPE